MRLGLVSGLASLLSIASPIGFMRVPELVDPIELVEVSVVVAKSGQIGGTHHGLLDPPFVTSDCGCDSFRARVCVLRCIEAYTSGFIDTAEV